MSKKLKYMAAMFFASIGSVATSAHADWPDRVFAPYVYQGGPTVLMDCYHATGQKYFTLAFVNAVAGPATGRGGRRGAAAPAAPVNPNAGQPAWGNGQLVSSGYMKDQIDALRAVGGDVIISFGGAGANELALAETDPVKLQAKYQQVIDEYKLTWMDFDTEDRAIGDYAVNHRRNIALAGLQKANPGLRIVYTLSCDPNADTTFPEWHTDGINKFGLDAVIDAEKRGVKIYMVNVMTFSYGYRFNDLIAKGETMGDLDIYEATAAYDQTLQVDPDMMIGITTESNGGFTTADNARELEWAERQSYVKLVSFWSLDSGGGRGGGGGRAATRAGGRAGAATRAGRGGAARGGAGRGGPPRAPYSVTNQFKEFTTGFNPAATQPSAQ